MRRSWVRRLTLLLGSILLFVTQAVAGTEASPPIQVLANGFHLGFDVEPVLQNQRVLVPWRVVAEFYGFSVDYRADEELITTTGGGRTVMMRVGQQQAYQNGQAVTLDVPPQVINGRTLVPLRFAGEALGLTVDWQQAGQIVRLTGAGREVPTVPALSLAEVRSVERAVRRLDFKSYRTYRMDADREALTGLVAAWSRAIPAINREMMLPMPPYGEGEIIQLAAGRASFTLAWFCQDEGGGGRGCTNTDRGYVYLLAPGESEPLLVYAPELASFIRNHPAD